MPQNKYLFGFILFLITILHVACNKESGSRTRSQLLTDQDWKLIASRYQDNNFGWIDDFSNWPDCRKDDVWSFKPNAVYIINEGASKCYLSAPEILREGTWEFIS